MISIANTTPGPNIKRANTLTSNKKSMQDKSTAPAQKCSSTLKPSLLKVYFAGNARKTAGYMGELTEELIKLIKKTDAGNPLGKSLKGRIISGSTLPFIEIGGPINLDGADCSFAVLENLRFSKNSTLRKADFSNSHIQKSVLSVNLSGSVFDNASLESVHAWDNVMNGVSFNNATISNSSLRGAKLHGSKFVNTIIKKTDASKAEFIGSDLSGAKIAEELPVGYKTLFGVLPSQSATTSKNNFSDADFTGATMKNIVIEGKDTFYKVNFRNTKFINADLSGAQLDKFIDFKGADFTGANLTGATVNLNHVKSKHVTFKKTAVDENTKFIERKGDDVTEHTIFSEALKKYRAKFKIV